MTKPKPKPLPVCGLPGCNQRTKNRGCRYCSQECAQAARQGPKLPPTDEIVRVAIDERIGTMQGLANRFSTTLWMMKKRLARDRIKVSDLRKPISAAILAEEPNLTAAEVLLRMGCRPGAMGTPPSKPKSPPRLSGQAVEIMQARSIMQADARSIVEYWQTPECDRWLFADEVREAAERRMRR